MTKKSIEQILEIYNSSYLHQISTEECFMLQKTLQRMAINKTKEQSEIYQNCNVTATQSGN